MRLSTSPACNAIRLRRPVGYCARSYSVRLEEPGSDGIKKLADLKAHAPGHPVPDVEISGWVRSVRKASGTRFVDVTDGSSMRPLQAVVEKSIAGEYASPLFSSLLTLLNSLSVLFLDAVADEALSSLRAGTAVQLRGTWHNTTGPDQDIGISETSRVTQDSPVALSDKTVPQGAATSPAQGNTGMQSMSELKVNQVQILGPSDPMVRPWYPIP